ncbi:MAG: PQQ-dependent dehydrogenase, methanol/ethanol family [Halieaceae bacterium]|nr:PQQ-dependent dehydrogenase, methanol/ethanol family [Halieaceae bacterium]
MQSYIRKFKPLHKAGLPFVAITLILLIVGCDHRSIGETPDTSSALPKNDSEWHFHGLDQNETRHSPLININKNNVSRLGLAWSTSLRSTRGLEATPIVKEGVMYVTSTWSRVFALNAKTGEVIWFFDPLVPREWAPKGCCDVVNRGVAVAGNQVFLGTFDGRLISLNARDGSLLWETNTIDKTKPYTITGAPRIAGDKVLIGNGGADFGVRGYVSAYDMISGEMKWRFYTVPAGTDGPHEHPELNLAAKTWDPNSAWEFGGGGTVWDSMAYDPEINLVYVGTGNGSPWPNFVRSPAGGDNLFLSTILALDADTGKMVWYYQTTPGDSWDYTATQHIILADIEWEGQPRKVLFQAPKNGFFYLIDRVSGELLAADKYVRTSWATHVDLKTGRPKLSDTANYSDHASIVFPATLGGHNWHPMSYSPRTGLVYIPAQDAATYFSPKNISVLLESDHYPNLDQVVPDPWVGFSILIGWDPIKREIEWKHVYPNFANAGVLSTASNLVIQGDAEGFLNFYDAATGKVIHRIQLGIGIIAPPITYMLDGEQYIAMAAGWGGATFVLAEADIAARKYPNNGKLLVLKLDGEMIPKPDPLPRQSKRRGGSKYIELSDTETLGKSVYNIHCGGCHGWFGHSGLLPDLKDLNEDKIKNLNSIVLDGALVPLGMPSFKNKLSESDVAHLQSYLLAVQKDDAR